MGEQTAADAASVPARFHSAVPTLPCVADGVTATVVTANSGHTAVLRCDPPVKRIRLGMLKEVPLTPPSRPGAPAPVPMQLSHDAGRR